MLPWYLIPISLLIGFGAGYTLRNLIAAQITKAADFVKSHNKVGG